MKEQPTHDRIEDHYGQQLSALMDGELSPDQARFLLRRLQHDEELTATWERWQLVGDALRGRVGVLLPDGFAERVAAATKADIVATPKASPSWLRWSGGAALAASVAVVALFVARQAPEAQAPTASAPAIVAAQPATTPGALPAAPVETIAAAPSIEPAAPMVASVDASSRVAAPRARSRRAPTMTAPVRPPEAQPTQVASAMAATPAPQRQNPFMPDIEPAARPWPRAVLPGLGNGGALATGVQATSEFYPFAPKLPDAQGVAETPAQDADSSSSAPDQPF